MVKVKPRRLSILLYKQWDLYVLPVQRFLKVVLQQTAAPAVTRGSSLSLASLVYSQGS